ncbi:hypothetical protein BCR34DRAFT_41787 [Clohesyomyces aquaticus]|uniref:Peptidase A2 domain-containing protein n=1 Tax=Clohesyomyces aquaticus TaxID=1231657 RepID=A0A1Y1Z6W9_9PLEO|nr:hypothetical protein BCR34DRAFT_41787 [Clohesyomyces aquaticus]
MSGIEVVGMVIGGFPILLNVIQGIREIILPKRKFLKQERETQRPCMEGLLNTLTAPFESLRSCNSGIKRQKYIPVSAKGVPVEAFPDTGSELDILSLGFVNQIDAGVNATGARTIELPTGHTIRTLGTVNVAILFEGESTVYRQTFHVLKSSRHKMILGKPFLETTQTLTKFAHRIRERLTSLATSIPRLHLLGSVTERVIGSINGIPTRGVDDIGSDVIVISWKEAKRLGLRINLEHSHRTYLGFVDGSEIYTDGAVIRADWRFGSSTAGKAIKVDL